MFVHHTRAPLGLRHPDHHKCAVVLGPVKDKPSRVALARHPVTAPARAGRVAPCGSGRGNGLPSRTRKLEVEIKWKKLPAPP